MNLSIISGMALGERITANTPARRFNLVGKVSTYVLIAALTALPLLRLLVFLSTTGENNISNDYAMFLPQIDRVLAGGYTLGQWFRDSFYVSHFQPFPILVYLGAIRFTGWNIYAELYFVLAISALRLILTYQALTSLTRSRWSLWLLPAISFLIFSPSQVSSYEFGASAVPLGLTTLGLAVGIWGLTRRRGRWAGIAWMAAGGLIASWSAASGLIAWGLLFLGMILLGYRRILHYAAFFITALMINFPYAYFLVLDRQPGTNAYLQSVFNPRLIANMLGRPFANGIGATTGYLPLGEIAGWAGILLLVAGLFILIRRLGDLISAVPALLYTLFGLLSVWETSVFRTAIAPWYTSFAMPFWIGLAGLTCVVYARTSDHNRAMERRWLTQAAVGWAFITALSIGFFYLISNRTLTDKSFYLVSRSPASAACLRNVTTAPTYCERLVFQWPVNRVMLGDFAWPLQHYGLNVFAARQRWTLQGDVILGTVTLQGVDGSSTGRWVREFSEDQDSWKSYERLNPEVGAGEALIWSVNLPGDAKEIDFVSAVGVRSRTPLPEEAGVEFKILAVLDGEPENVLYAGRVDGANHWQPVRFSLIEYAGKRVTLVFKTNTSAGLTDAGSLFRYPHINLLLPPQAVESMPAVTPSNTDLSSDFPKIHTQDLIIPLADVKTVNLKPVPGQTHTWSASMDPYLTYVLEQPACLEAYPSIYIRISASLGLAQRGMRLYLSVDGQDGYPYSAVIPLLAGEELHAYTYDTHLFEAPPGTRVTGIRLDPVIIGRDPGVNRIAVTDIRFLADPAAASRCSP